MTTDKDQALFDTVMGAARDQRVRIDDALLDRIMLDADAVLAEAATPQTPGAGAGAGEGADIPRRPLGAVLWSAIGGWPALGSMAAATVAGLWIGVAPPDALAQVTQSVWGASDVEVPLLQTENFLGLEG